MGNIVNLFLFVSIGVAAWFIAERNERNKRTLEKNSLESQLKSAEKRAFLFRDESAKLKSSLLALENQLQQERQTALSTSSGFQHVLRRGMIISGVASLCVGILSGGLIGGTWFGYRLDQRYREKIMQMDIISRVANINAENYKTQYEDLKKEFTSLRLALDEERVAKTIALTKLDVVLDNLVVDRWGKGYALDPKKLKENWERSSKVKPTSDTAKFIPPPVPAF